MDSVNSQISEEVFMKDLVRGQGRPAKQPRKCGNCSFFPKGEKEGHCHNSKGRPGLQKKGDDCCNHHHYRHNGF